MRKLNLKKLSSVLIFIINICIKRRVIGKNQYSSIRMVAGSGIEPLTLGL